MNCNVSGFVQWSDDDADVCDGCGAFFPFPLALLLPTTVSFSPLYKE